MQARAIIISNIYQESRLENSRDSKQSVLEENRPPWGNLLKSLGNNVFKRLQFPLDLEVPSGVDALLLGLCTVVILGGNPN